MLKLALPIYYFCMLTLVHIPSLRGNEKSTTLSRWDNVDQSVASGKTTRNATFQRLLRRPRDQYSSAMAYKFPKNYAVMGPTGHGWNPRQVTAFGSPSLHPSQSSQNPSNEYPYAAGLQGTEEDNNVAADNNGGWGWGWDSGKGCNSALGLLGVLGLASYLQNVLNNMDDDDDDDFHFVDVPGGGGGVNLPGGGGNLPKRGKRDTKSNKFSGSNFPGNSATAIIPHLLRLNRIRERDWPVQCSSYPICMINRLINQGQDNSFEGQGFKKMIRTIIEHVLEPLSTPSQREKLEIMDLATHIGSKKGECHKVFRDCSAFQS